MSKKHQHINKDSLKDIAPKLNSMGKANPFDVPDGYFSQMQNDIFSKINNPELITPKQKPIHKLWAGSKTAIGIAAATISAVILISFFTQKQENEISDNTPVETENINPQNQNSVNGSTSPYHQENIANNDQAPDTEGNQSMNPGEASPIQNDQNGSNAIQPRQIAPYQQVDLNNQNAIAHKSDNSNAQQQGVSFPNNGMNPVSGQHPNAINNNQHTTAARQKDNNKEKINKNDLIENNNVALAHNLSNYSITGHECNENTALLSCNADFNKYTFEWSTGEYSQEIKVTESGEYLLTLINKKNREERTTLRKSIRVLQLPEVNLGDDLSICSDEVINLFPFKEETDVNQFTYNWQGINHQGAVLQLQNLDPGIYRYAVEVNACKTYSDEIIIKVIDCNISIPNVITPNGDGYNDYLVINGLDRYPGSSLQIYTRNGKKVFDASDYKNNWDANNLPKGTYFYYLQINDQAKTKLNGTITVLR